MHGGGLQHHAQVVELLELVEVEGQHAPAAAEQHFDEAFLLQPEQRLAHRRARDAQPLADLVLGEAVAGHQAELGDVALELRVDLVGARAERGDRWRGRRVARSDGRHAAMLVRAERRQQLRAGRGPADDGALGADHLDAPPP